MKSFVIKEPYSTALTNIEMPSPEEGEVLLKIDRIGMCGTDLSTFTGRNPLVAYPRIPGHEISAVVEQVTSRVPPDIREGMKVTVYPYRSCGSCAACRQGRTNCCRYNKTLGVQRDGALQEYFAISWQNLIPAENLSSAERALVEPLSIGMHAVDRGEITPEDTVGVFGCGVVGLSVIAGANSAGATVVAIDIDDSKLKIAQRCGATHVINSATMDLRRTLGDITGGHGPEVMVKAVGSPQTFRAAVDEVSFAGRVVYIGYTRDPVEYETQFFVKKELDIRGSRNATRDDFQRVMEILRSEQFPVEKVVTDTVLLSQAGEALRVWSEAPQAYTKIQVRFEE